MELTVYNVKGEDTGKKVSLNEAVFAIEPSDQAIYLDVKQHLANKRQGTHKSKERAEITGSTRKIKKQKGTGTARAGSIKSPIFRGGGRIFGPRPRSYSSKLNKKVKQLARLSALTYKAQRNEIKVVDTFSFDAPKTKEYISFINNMQLEGKKSLFVLGGENKNVYLSARNVPKADVVTLSELNTYNILNNKCLILSVESLEQINSQNN